MGRARTLRAMASIRGWNFPWHDPFEMGAIAFCTQYKTSGISVDGPRSPSSTSLLASSSQCALLCVNLPWSSWFVVRFITPFRLFAKRSLCIRCWIHRLIHGSFRFCFQFVMSLAFVLFLLPSCHYLFVTPPCTLLDLHACLCPYVPPSLSCSVFSSCLWLN